MLRGVNAIFTQASIRVFLRELVVLPEARRVLETIRERRALRRELRQTGINLFVVDEIVNTSRSAHLIRQVEAAGGDASGPIRFGGLTIGSGSFPDRYVMVAGHDDAELWAHELAHAFWLPHQRDPENLMSYGGGTALTGDQVVRMRRNASRLLGLGSALRGANRWGLTQDESSELLPSSAGSASEASRRSAQATSRNRRTARNTQARRSRQARRQRTRQNRDRSERARSRSTPGAELPLGDGWHIGAEVHIEPARPRVLSDH